MDFSDIDEYNLYYISDDSENYIFDQQKNDNNQGFCIPIINNNDNQSTNFQSPEKENSSPLSTDNYYLSENVKYELNLWLFNHQNRPYMNTQTKNKFARRLNVSVDSISLFLCEHRRKERLKQHNINQS